MIEYDDFDFESTDLTIRQWGNIWLMYYNTLCLQDQIRQVKIALIEDIIPTLGSIKCRELNNDIYKEKFVKLLNEKYDADRIKSVENIFYTMMESAAKQSIIPTEQLSFISKK
ncbi:hypothetical protein ACYSNR_03075 [Enterococcus sp. LJL128]